MKKRLTSLPLFLLLYLAVVLGYFTYAGLTGMRLLGDSTEKYDPSGPDGRSNNNVRTSRFYHK
jgi:hypothetical protein